MSILSFQSSNIMNFLGLTVSRRVCLPLTMVLCAVVTLALDTGLETGAVSSDDHLELGVVFKFPFSSPADINLNIHGEEIVISWSTKWTALLWCVLVLQFTDILLLLLHCFKKKSLTCAILVFLSGLVSGLVEIGVKGGLYMYLRHYFDDVRFNFDSGIRDLEHCPSFLTLHTWVYFCNRCISQNAKFFTQLCVSSWRTSVTLTHSTLEM